MTKKTAGEAVSEFERRAIAASAIPHFNPKSSVIELHPRRVAGLWPISIGEKLPLCRYDRERKCDCGLRGLCLDVA
jgi:hypothetical protein